MTAKRKKIIILSLVFLLTFLYGLLGKREAGQISRSGSAFSGAAWPIMCFEWGEYRLNPLYGSTNQEAAGSDYQTVYPLTEDKLEMTVCLLDGQERPRSISYELRDEGGGRLVSRGSIASFEGEKNALRFQLRFEDILQADRYYHLHWTVDMVTGTLHYYTRVIRLSDAKPLEALTAYAVKLHSDLLSRETARAYQAYMETDTRTDKNTLAYVNINGSFDQLAWGSSQVTEVSSPWMTLEAIQTNYAYYTFDSLMEAGAPESRRSFRVRESVGLQYSENAIYWLNYERHAQQLWDPMENISSAAGFLLGVQEVEKLQRVSSSNEKYTAFVVAGELYCYDAENQKLVRIFSFRRSGAHELRILQQDYDIKILEVSDQGTVDFVVSGYMNGGPREGACGLSFMRYQPERRRVEEHIFLASRQSPRLLLKELDRLLMKGNDHFLYFAFDGQVLVMDISTGETAVLVSRNEYKSLQVNERGTVFAWGSGSDPARPDALRIVDLEKGKNANLSGGDQDFTRPLGFIQEDLLVGYGSWTDPGLFNGVEPEYPMNRLVILDSEQHQIYQYVFENILITGVEISEEKVVIHRFSRQAESGVYSYMDADVMLRNDGEGNQTLDFSESQSETMMKTLVLSHARLPSSLRISRETADSFVPGAEISLPGAVGEEPLEQYYAYGKGQLLAVCATPGEAIRIAAEAYAHVLDGTGRLIWCWSPRRESQVLPQVTTGFDGEKDPLNVSGAGYRPLLYYLNENLPIYWLAPDMTPQWVIGYEWQNVILFNPETGETYRMPQESFEESIRRDNNNLWIPDNP